MLHRRIADGVDRGKKIVQVQLDLRDLPFLPLDHVWILHIEIAGIFADR